METTYPIIHVYERVKINRYDNQYVLRHELPTGSFLTTRVKVEAYQGYSKAYNLGEYFRLRGSTSWKNGEQVTGLFKTSFPNVFYGNRKESIIRTLMLFKYEHNKDALTVYTFNHGFYPNKKMINEIIKSIL